MKKVLVTILAFTYLAVSSGATLNLHYCMGKLVSWDLSHQQDAKCGTCGMKKAGHKGCCKDEHKTFQIDKDQKTTESAFHYLPLFSDVIIPTYGALAGLPVSSIAINYPTSHAPPPIRPIPIFVLHCHFRIWFPSCCRLSARHRGVSIQPLIISLTIKIFSEGHP